MRGITLRPLFKHERFAIRLKFLTDFHPVSRAVQAAICKTAHVSAIPTRDSISFASAERNNLQPFSLREQRLAFIGGEKEFAFERERAGDVKDVNRS